MHASNKQRGSNIRYVRYAWVTLARTYNTETRGSTRRLQPSNASLNRLQISHHPTSACQIPTLIHRGKSSSSAVSAFIVDSCPSEAYGVLLVVRRKEFEQRSCELQSLHCIANAQSCFARGQIRQAVVEAGAGLPHSATKTGDWRALSTRQRSPGCYLPRSAVRQLLQTALLVAASPAVASNQWAICSGSPCRTSLHWFMDR